MHPLPRNIDSNELIRIISDISWEVCDLLNSYNKFPNNSSNLDRELNIQNLDKGPVTEADIKASELIIKRIQSNFPKFEWQFLSEESNFSKISFPFEENWVWIIDPLDGTRDFINGTGEYAMHLALTFMGIPIMGVVLIPYREELWIFYDGLGTWCETKKSKINKFLLKETTKLSQMRIVTSRSHRSKELISLIEKIEPKELIGMGSVGFKTTAILRDQADLYISYSPEGQSCPKDWDIASPESIIRGAGGYMTDIKGNNLKFLVDKKFNQKGMIIASINSNHKLICKEIENILKLV